MSGTKDGTAGTKTGSAMESNEDAAPRSRARTYAAVVALEAAVIVALWMFSRHFSA
jgi:hypothetical protein